MTEVGITRLENGCAGVVRARPVIGSKFDPASPLMALGLLLSMATQLRPAYLPIGPGEACLAAAILLTATDALRSGRTPIPLAFWVFLVFWLAFAMAQSIGFLAGGLIGDLRDIDLVIHDVATYPLLIAITCLSVMGPDAQIRMRRTAWHVAGLGAVLAAAQIASGFGLFELSMVDPWYWDRFRGWTANPNQMALFCLIISCIALHLSDVADAGWKRAGALLCAATGVSVGLFAKTNAFNLAVALILVLYLCMIGSAWLSRSGSLLTFRSAAAWIAVLLIPLLAVASVPLLASLPDRAVLASSFGRDNSNETDQEAQLRLELWRKAIERGFETDMLGLGPGPHLPIPALLLQARWGEPYEPMNVQHPTPGIAPNFEAHNTVLELFVQGGLLGVVSFLAIIAASICGTYRAHRLLLASAICGIVAFGSFHVITRHPAVWFVIALGLAESTFRQRSQTLAPVGGARREPFRGFGD
jgi:O-antigen ligase